MAQHIENYEDMTVAELHEKAKDAGLTGTSHMKKEELVEALSKNDGSKSESHAKTSKNDGDAAQSKSDHKNDSAHSSTPARDDKGHFEKSDSKATAKK